jgi:hypothetical protein
MLIFFVKCNSNKHEKKGSNFSKFDTEIQTALLKGYFIKEGQVYICIFKNKIYLFTNARKGFSENKFLLHYIDSNDNFLNHDFHKNSFLVNDSLISKFKNFEILKLPMKVDNYKSIRLGQFQRDDHNKPKNLWVKKISKLDIERRSHFYKDEFIKHLSINLLKENFQNSLKTKSFFKTSQNLYILLNDDFIYFLAPKDYQIDSKFMLHYIKDDYTFINSSFYFKDFKIQDCLNEDIYIARLPLPRKEEYSKIRIGQFTKTENIWVQEFLPEKIKNNPLLKFNGEFSLLSN